jgi:SAM-dependent methyltransferase
MDINNNTAISAQDFLKNFWDKVASEHQSTATFNYEIFQNTVKDKNAAILEVGCGYGRILNNLYTLGYKNSIGIDISQNMLDRGKKESPHLKLLYTKGVPFELKDKQFDVVLLLGVLCSVVADQDQLALINESKRLLKVGGIIYISDFLMNNAPENIKLYNNFSAVNNSLPYGVFKLDDQTPLFRHHDPTWIKKHLTVPFTMLHYNEEVFKTMRGGTNDGFLYVGQLDGENV